MGGENVKNDVLEELTVVKRSGQRVSFNGYKIAVAIKHAFDHIYDQLDEQKVNKVYEDVLSYIEENYNGRKTINVEDIQDIIEKTLKSEKHLDVYEAFSEYRQKRAASRKVFTIKQQHKFAKAMEKIDSDNILRTDNNFTANEILIKYGKIVTDGFTKSYILDNKYLRAHEEGNIYVNDMQSFSLGIVSHTHLMMENFLDNNSIEDLINEILKSHSEISGRINIPNIDILLSKWFVKTFKFYFEDYLINYLRLLGFEKYLNVKKIIEIIHKENILETKLNSFSQFILSCEVEKIFERAYDDAINKVINKLKTKLTKILERLDGENNSNCSFSFGTGNSLVIEIILNILNKLGPLENVHFIFKIKNGNYEKYLDLVNELIINQKNIELINEDSSFNKDKNEVEYFTNGIRIFENVNSDERKSTGRMVVSTTSVNMARLALKTKDDKEFYQSLDDILELVKNELLLSFETIGNKNKDNYRAIFNGNILDDEKLERSQNIRKVIKNGVLNIGLVGLKECVLLMCPNKNKQYNFLVSLLEYVNTKCQKFSSDTRLNFYVCEPSDYIVRKEFMALDKAIYGTIENITEKDSYDYLYNLESIKDDYKKIAHIQSLIKGGNMVEVNLLKNTSKKKLTETIKQLIDSDIGFVKINVGKRGS